MTKEPGNIEVSILMGSSSDLVVMNTAAEVLKEFGISYEITVVSAHRTPKRLYDFASSALARGIEVIIAGAGGAAHLPGMIASITSIPVIGVPVKTNSLNGIDSLLSIVQMPKGVPVATVAIDGAYNAGILAVQILGVKNGKYRELMSDYKKRLEQKVLDSISQIGNKTNYD